MATCDKMEAGNLVGMEVLECLVDIRSIDDESKGLFIVQIVKCCTALFS